MLRANFSQIGFKPDDHLSLELYGRSPEANKADAVSHGLMGDAHHALVKEWLCDRPSWTVEGPQWGKFLNQCFDGRRLELKKADSSYDAQDTRA